MAMKLYGVIDSPSLKEGEFSILIYTILGLLGSCTINSPSECLLGILFLFGSMHLQ